MKPHVGTMDLTIDEEEDGEQPACKVDSIVQSHWEVETCHSGKAGSHIFLSGPLVLELPISKEPFVDLLGDLIYQAVAFVLKQGWRCRWTSL